jgi:phosphate transport system protein
MSAHIVKRYDEELSELKKRILAMGGMVEKMIADAMRALIERDGDLARSVIQFDHEVNLKELEIDDQAINLLAMRQPVASDLRLITMAMKINTDLERMGDAAVNLSERALELLEEGPLKPYVDLPRMAALVQEMVTDALNAFVDRDLPKAQLVIESDDVIDALYLQIFRELLTLMMSDPRAIARGIRVIFVAKYLERIADHATNIAEMVTFLIEGEDVRHPSSQRFRERREG